MTEQTAPPANADVEALAYDDAFAELQRVVTRLEAGGESLEATIALYERAVALQHRCEGLLAQAELRVQQLMPRPGGLVVEDLRPGEGQSDEGGPGGGRGGPGGHPATIG